MKLLSSIKVATIATTALTLSILPTLAQSFPDISDNVYKTEIDVAVEKGIVEGFPDGNFQPDETVTRGQAAVMITKGIASVTPIDLDAKPANRTVPPFNDVPDDLWSAKEIYWLQANLYPANVSQLTGNFRPDDPITRIELVDFLRRTAELVSSRLTGGDSTLPEVDPAIEFSDVTGYEKILTEQMSEYCRVASPLNEEGDAFAPTEEAHRDYTAAAIVRAVDCGGTE